MTADRTPPMHNVLPLCICRPTGGVRRRTVVSAAPKAFATQEHRNFDNCQKIPQLYWLAACGFWQSIRAAIACLGRTHCDDTNKCSRCGFASEPGRRQTALRQLELSWLVGNVMAGGRRSNRTLCLPLGATPLALCQLRYQSIRGTMTTC